MDRAQKQEHISYLNNLVEKQTFIAVTHYKGLTVKQLEDLREQAREVGAGFKITKNRLMKLALSGTKFEGLKDLFSGPTAIAYSEDPVAAAKVCAGFSKDNNQLIILGGSLDGEVMDISQVQSLAKLPSLQELRGKMVGLLNAPPTRIAVVAKAPSEKLASIIMAKSLSDKAA